MPISVNLAGKEYVLPRKFILKELRELSSLSCTPKPEDPAKAELWMFETTAQMVEIALERMGDKITAEELWMTETSITELITARLIILGHSELLGKGEPKKGEAPAAV
jgi:hypothetical protein